MSDETTDETTDETYERPPWPMNVKDRTLADLAIVVAEREAYLCLKAGEMVRVEDRRQKLRQIIVCAQAELGATLDAIAKIEREW